MYKKIKHHCYFFEKEMYVLTAWLDLATSNSCIENLVAKFILPFPSLPVTFAHPLPTPSALVTLVKSCHIGLAL